MSEEARDLLDSIRSLAGQGLTPGQIAAQLTLIEDGVRNVLAMGRHAYNPGRRRRRTPLRSMPTATVSRGVSIVSLSSENVPLSAQGKCPLVWC